MINDSWHTLSIENPTLDTLFTLSIENSKWARENQTTTIKLTVQYSTTKTTISDHDQTELWQWVTLSIKEVVTLKKYFKMIIIHEHLDIKI